MQSVLIKFMFGCIVEVRGNMQHLNCQAENLIVLLGREMVISL